MSKAYDDVLLTPTVPHGRTRTWFDTYWGGLGVAWGITIAAAFQWPNVGYITAAILLGALFAFACGVSGNDLDNDHDTFRYATWGTVAVLVAAGLLYGAGVWVGGGE